jgi:dihydroorotate dehydrogenase (NAD+) catalytic subunit
VSGPDLSVTLAGVRLASPVLTASGCFGSGREMARFVDLGVLGAVVTKTVTLRPRQGIAPPRGAETPAGMLNAIGLQNPGVDRFVERDLAWLADRGVPAIASVGGESVEEYAACCERLRGAPAVVAIELNLSCPNLEDRGLVFALSPERTAEAVAAARRAADVPLLAKLSPDVTDLVAVAEAAVRAGADGLSLVNTTLGMAIDVRTFRARLSTGTGGLSGPAIRPIAVRCVWQVHRAMPGVPIVGMGGVATAEDALEMILAGATAVAVGTATFADPRAVERIRRGIEAFCRERGIASLEQIRGRVKVEG